MSSARVYGLLLAVLGAGALLVVLVTSRAWAYVELAGALRTERLPVTGSDLTPGIAAVGWLGLAGVLAVLATRRWGRRAVGALLSIGGVYGAIAALGTGARLAGEARDWAVRTQGVGGSQVQVSTTGWPWTAAAGCLLVLAAGVMIAWVGHRLPALGSRYDRAGAAATARTSEEPAAAPSAGQAPAANHAAARPPAEPAPPDGKATWDALDRGDDPTE